MDTTSISSVGALSRRGLMWRKATPESAGAHGGKKLRGCVDSSQRGDEGPTEEGDLARNALDDHQGSVASLRCIVWDVHGDAPIKITISKSYERRADARRERERSAATASLESLTLSLSAAGRDERGWWFQLELTHGEGEQPEGVEVALYQESRRLAVGTLDGWGDWSHRPSEHPAKAGEELVFEVRRENLASSPRARRSRSVV